LKEGLRLESNARVRKKSRWKSQKKKGFLKGGKKSRKNPKGPGKTVKKKKSGKAGSHTRIHKKCTGNHLGGEK